MANKPILPNAFVDIETQNLGLIPTSPAGVFAFAGIAQDGTAAFDAIVSIGNLNEVKARIGFGEIADFLIDFFNNGGRKAFVIPLDIVTLSTISAVTPARVSTSTGLVAAAAVGGKKVTNEFDFLVEITKTGETGVGKFKVSTDNGKTFGPVQVIPATFTPVGTNVIMTFTDGAGPLEWEVGDKFTFTTDKPAVSTVKVEEAADTHLDSNNVFDALVIGSEADASLINSIGTKIKNAEGSPNFRFTYGIMFTTLSTSATQAVTQATTLLGAVARDRIQIVTGEAVTNRPNHGDQRDRNVLAIIAGRRSALDLRDDLGLFSAGQLSNVISLRTGWTETTIEDLDALRTVTIRQFKGTAGFRPTNGHLSDPFSDFTKDAWRLVIDKASRRARLTGLSFLKVVVDPTDVQASTKPLRVAIQGNLDLIAGTDGDAVSFDVQIPDGQDILVTEQLDVNINAIVFGHASFIGITIGITNPLVQI